MSMTTAPKITYRDAEAINAFLEAYFGDKINDSAVAARMWAYLRTICPHPTYDGAINDFEGVFPIFCPACDEEWDWGEEWQDVRRSTAVPGPNG